MWVSLAFLVLGLGIAYYMYTSGKMTNPVPAEHQVKAPDGRLEAIEYFWRPG